MDGIMRSLHPRLSVLVGVRRRGGWRRRIRDDKLEQNTHVSRLNAKHSPWLPKPRAWAKPGQTQVPRSMRRYSRCTKRSAYGPTTWE